MGEYGLGEHKIKRLAELTAVKLCLVTKYGLLDPYDILSQLIFETLVNQPFLWFNAEIVGGHEIGDE